MFFLVAVNHGLTVERPWSPVAGESSLRSTRPQEMLAGGKVCPVERALSDAELKHFWQTIENTEGIGPVMALLSGFDRQVSASRTSSKPHGADYDLDAGTVLLVHRKGRAGRP